MPTESEVEELRAEVARLAARVAELEAGGATSDAALAESRQRLDYALGVAGIVTWDWDPASGHVLHSHDVNRNLEGRVSTRNAFARLIHPDDAARTAATFEAAFRSNSEYRHEYRIVTPAGTRWILSAGRPFAAPDGRRRMSGVMFDVTARHESDAELRAADARLRLAVTAANLGDWSVDQAAGLTTLSERAAALFGMAGPVTLPRGEVQSRVHPEDIDRVRLEVEGALERRESYAIEYRVGLGEGHRWIFVAGQGRYDDAGVLIGQIGVMQDITARREADDRQQLLMSELNHRVKNTLAIVQALALQSRRGSTTPEAFSASFDGRLRALSAAHSLLTRTSWQGAEVADVARGALRPFDSAGHRIGIAGPAVLLASSVALNLTLGLHELATNALKYGALSGIAGDVALDWSVEGDALVVRWRELGGPPVVAPERRGFGVRLIREGVTREVGGTAEIDFRPEGLACEMRLPLSAKVRPL